MTETCSAVVWLQGGRVKAIGSSHQTINDYLESTSQPPGTEEQPLDTEHPVRIEKVRVLGADGTPRVVYRTGEELMIAIGYTAVPDAPKVGFGVTIARSDGTYCYATNSQTDVVTGIPVEEQGEVLLALRPLTLLPGAFFVDVTIFERRTHSHYDFREHAAMFKVYSDSAERGVCVLPHEWIIGTDIPASAAHSETSRPL